MDKTVGVGVGLGQQQAGGVIGEVVDPAVLIGGPGEAVVAVRGQLCALAVRGYDVRRILSLYIFSQIKPLYYPENTLPNQYFCESKNQR